MLQCLEYCMKYIFHYKRHDTVTHTSTETSWNMPGGPSGCKQPCPHHTDQRSFPRRQTGSAGGSGRSQGTVVHLSVPEEQGWNEEGRMCASSGAPVEVRPWGCSCAYNGHIAAVCFWGNRPQCDEVSIYFSITKLLWQIWSNLIFLKTVSLIETSSF